MGKVISILGAILFVGVQSFSQKQLIEQKKSKADKNEIKKTEAKTVAAPVQKYFVNSNNSSIEITPDAIAASRTTGSAGDNTALGLSALELDQGNSGNTAIGYHTLKNSTTSLYNTALGSYALNSIQTKGKNTAIGNQALTLTSDGTELLHGTENTAVGFGALKSNTIGYFNHAFGSNALGFLQTGVANVAIGTNALSNNTIGSSNIAIGHLAATGKHSGSSSNIAIGSNTLQFSGQSSNNIAIGKSSQFSNTTGNSNISIGTEALQNNSSGSGNIAIGNEAGQNETGNNKLYIANNASTPFLYGDLTIGNVAFNAQNPENFFQIHNPSIVTNNYLHITNQNSGITNIDGIEIGMTANYGDTYFWQNENSNFTIATNAGNSYLKLATGASTKLGVGRTPTTNALEVSGDASKTVAGSFIANSDQRLKKNIKPLESTLMLNKVLKMQGVTYEWNDNKTEYDRPKGIQTGFIAQDLEKIWPEKIKKDAQGYLMTAYSDYDPMFVEAIKALYQKIQKLETENQKIQEEKNALSARLSKIEEWMHGQGGVGAEIIGSKD